MSDAFAPDEDRAERPVRALGDRVLRWSPMQPVFRAWASRRLAVLAYHAVDDPGRFAEHLDFLRRRTHPISLDELMGAMDGGPRPERAVLITFDDADRTVLEVAAPLLRERGLPAVAFVVAGLLDGDRPVWTAEVRRLVALGGTAPGVPPLGPRDTARYMKGLPEGTRVEALEELRQTGGPVVERQLRREDLLELEAAGVAVGNHTLTHPPLPTCTDEGLAEEIRRAHEVLATSGVRAPTAFAFPEGAADGRARAVLRSLGYRAGFLFDHAVGPLPPADPMMISRVRADADVDLDRLRIVISGLHPAIHSVRTRVRRRAPASAGRRST